MFDFNSFNFLVIYFLFIIFSFILFFYITIIFIKINTLKKQNDENNMEIHEINKEILKLRGCFCEISNFLNNYPVKDNGENKENGNK